MSLEGWVPSSNPSRPSIASGLMGEADFVEAAAHWAVRQFQKTTAGLGCRVWRLVPGGWGLKSLAGLSAVCCCHNLLLQG